MHIWIANPAYKALGGKWTIGWVLESANNEIVGYLGNIPRQYEFRAKPVIAAASHGLVVDAQYRSYSISLLSRFFSQQRAGLLLNTTANAAASKAYSAFHVSRVPVGAWDRSTFWITNYPAFASSLLASRSIPLATVLGFSISPFFHLQDKIVGGFRGSRRKANGRFVESFDHRFDEFWCALKTKRSNMLLATRTLETLKWHYKYAFLRKHVWVLVHENGSKILAYAIFCRQDNPKYGLKRVRLVDFQSIEDSTVLLYSMLVRVVDRCQDEGIHMLEIIGSRAVKDHAINSVMPRRRQLPSWLYFYAVRDQCLGESLHNPAVWDPTCYDGDSSL